MVSEHKLLRGVASRDQQAFRTLYAEYQRRLFVYFMKMIRDEGRAEELVNDVMWEVWRGAQSYEGRSALSTWIFGIAHHKAMDEVRRRRPQMMEEEVLDRVADPAEGAVEAMEKQDVAQAMKLALGKLSAEHREVLEMTYYQHFSVQEIAETLGIPEGTVKTRMFYARQRLKEILKQMGFKGEGS